MMRSGLRTMAIVFLCVACKATALAQNLPTNAVQDYRWISGTASAALVLAPPKLTGVTRWTIESRRHRGIIWAAAQSPDGKLLAAGGVDGVVRIWNLDAGCLDRAIVADRFGLDSMAWSPDGAKLASIGGDARVRIWDVQTGRLLAEPLPRAYLSSLAWSHDSRRLAANHPSDGSGPIRVSDALGDFKVVKEAGKAVPAVAWSRDSGLLAYAAAGEPVTVVETSGWAFRYSLDQRPEDQTRTMAWSPDGELLATVGATGAATWKVDDGAAVGRTTGSFGTVAWAPDSSRFLAAASTGLFIGADGKGAGNFPAGGRIFWNAATGRITSVTADTIQVWEPDGTKPLVSINAGGSQSPVFQVGKPLVTGLGTKVLSVWNQNTFKRIATLEGHTAAATLATWSRDGKHFASGGADGTVCLWDVDKGERLHSLTAHNGPVTALAWAPDGDFLASAGADKNVRLWTADGAEKGSLSGHANAVVSLAWAPKAALVASGGRDQKMIIWNPDTGEQVQAIDCRSWPVAIDWTTVKGVSALACGMQDGAAKVFNAMTGVEIATLIEGSPRWPHGFGGIAWTPGAQPGLLTVRWHVTQLWDIAKKDTVARQIAPGGGGSVFPTTGGRVAVVRAADRTTRFWSPSDNGLVGVLLDDGGPLAAITTTGDVKFDPEEPPDLIAIIETTDGHQKILPLDELKAAHGWKNSGKAIKLPTKN